MAYYYLLNGDKTLGGDMERQMYGQREEVVLAMVV